jgi:hypothetical protein
MHCWINWFEYHKDLWLALGALLSPFAAVAVGLFVAKSQARALLLSTQLQVRASGLRDYQQKLIEKLREELAAQIFEVSQMINIKEKKLGVEAWEKADRDIIGRQVRIRLLGATSADALNKYLGVFESVMEHLGKVELWSEEEKREFHRRVDTLGEASLKLLQDQMRLASGPSLQDEEPSFGRA